MEHIVQIGVREVEPEEAIHLEQSGITRIGPNDVARLREVVSELAKRVGQVYVHVDVDVLDLSEGWANTYACRGGLTLEDLYGALEMIGPSVKIGAASITSYYPEADRDNRIGRAIPHLVELLAG